MKNFLYKNLCLPLLSFSLILCCTFAVQNAFANSFGSMISGIEKGSSPSNSSSSSSSTTTPQRTPSAPSRNAAPISGSIDFNGLVDLLDNTDANQIILLNFYASWCPPCMQEIPHLIRIRKDFPESQVFMVGINLDNSKAAMDAVNAKLGINYHTYHDKNNNILNEFGANSIPFNVVIDRKGTPVYAESGYVDYTQFARILKNALR